MGVKQEALDLGDYVFGRFMGRLDGLTDDEYFWEPVAGCWNLHVRDDGTVRGDWGLIFEATPPVTTIAWRLSHIVDFLTAERCATWLGLEPAPGSRSERLAATAARARADLERAYAVWRGYVAAVDDDVLAGNSGPIAGPYADYSRAGFVFHILDELVHHAAEIALLRDLYRARATHDDFVDACLRGDRAAVNELRAADPAVVDRTIATRPDLMREASEMGRWSAFTLLADLGFAVDGTGERTALHHAAGAGAVDAVRTLVELGADVTKKDPTYNSTPLQWADYFNRTDAADYLRALSTSAAR
jgi:hypothetical protein